MADKSSSKNIERRKRRRYKKRVKTSVKIGVVSFVLVVSLASWIAYRVYLMKTYVNPFGEVDASKEESVELIDDEDIGTVSAEAYYDVLDLAGGEAIFIRCNGIEALVDTGTKDSSKALVKELSGKVSGKLDYLIITSPSAQRTGGVAAVAKEYQIGTCVLGELGESGKRAVGRDIAGKADRVVDGKSASYDFGEGVTLFVIKPEVSSSDVKDRSLVTYFKVKDHGFLAFSDAGREEVARASSGIQTCEAVVLPQHGTGDSIKNISKTITASTFVASSPKDSGFPSPEIEEMFYDRVFSTGKAGTISFLIKNDSVACSTDDESYKSLLNEGNPEAEEVNEEEGAPVEDGEGDVATETEAEDAPEDEEG